MSRINGVPARGRQGFTLVELLTVVLIVGLLAGIATPNLKRALLRARATGIVGELQVVRVGVYNHLGDQHTWPSDYNRGQIPPELAPYLPDGFSFVTEDYTLDYDNWAGKSGRRWRNTFDVGVTIIMPDKELGDEVLRILGANTWSNGRDKFTWALEGRGGS